MSDTFNDPFADIDLDNFKAPKKKNENDRNKSKVIDISDKEKDVITKVAEDNNFISREPVKNKSKTRPCTFSLREEEEDIIHNYINLTYSKHRRTKVTGSDVVRAGLYLLLKYEDDDVIDMMMEKRGRG